MSHNANEFIDEVDNKIGQIDTTAENSFDQQLDRGKVCEHHLLIICV